MLSPAFGEYIKRLRIQQRMTLRDFCARNGFDPGNYSRLERGLFPPPQRQELLERYAVALGLEPGTDDWLEFFDLAAASRGQLPKDLLSDDQLLAKLPVLFRTLRGTPVPADKLGALVEKIRKGG